MSQPDLFTAATAWWDAGVSVVRVAADGSKRPDGTWKQFQTERATREQVTFWFADGIGGLGVICGAVSGNLEMLEFEGRAVTDGTLKRFLDSLTEAGHGELRAKLSGYNELSPSGGVHFLYRVDEPVDGNTKLARRPAGGSKVDVLIETRGEGGFVVIAPSAGAVHPSGKAWKAVQGSPAELPTLTGAERAILHAHARELDEMPVAAPIPDPIALDPQRRGDDKGLAPGDDYNARGSWDELLTRHGWRVVAGGGVRTYWCRPIAAGEAKSPHAISAVTGGEQGDYFWAWTTSTELPSEEAMSKWRVYALLEHGGDFPAAAKALRRKGYGAPLPEPTRPVLTALPGINAGIKSDTDGSSARQLETQAPVTTYLHSDDGNAQALVETYGDVIRYCADRGLWLTWTGQRWSWCERGGGPIREYAKRIARALPEDETADKRHKARSLGAIGTTAMLAQAQTDPRIAVSIDDLDNRPYELNTPAGIYDLRTGRLGAADATHLHTRITACAPDQDADPTRWRGFLADTFTGHDELPGYLQRLIGYAATGVVRDHVLPFCFGGGANGKGVFLETIRAVLGDYATTAPSGFLMAKIYTDHETEIARLAGARMVTCSEVNEGDRFDEAKVKQLTGGDTLTARFMRQDHFTFSPTHKLWLMGNHQPQVAGGGHSFWRRLRIIPFDNTVAEDKQVDDLQYILAAEHGPAVLAWIIAGSVAYFAQGLTEPASVKTATTEYAHDQDTVARFVEDRCHLGGGDAARVRMSELRAAYEAWCRAEGASPVNANRFGRTLTDSFDIGKGKSNGRKYYSGITIYADEDEEQS